MHGFFPVSEPIGQDQCPSGRKENQPEECEVHEAVVDVDDKEGTVLLHDLVPNRKSEEPA